MEGILARIELKEINGWIVAHKTNENKENN